MKFSACFLLFLVIVAVAGFSKNGVEAKEGICGKFSPDRMVTHVLRHCAKPARDLRAPVPPNCCNELIKIPRPCIHAIIYSDALKNAGVNPDIAFTIPKRCGFVH